jgi:hypothetical protein
MQIGHHSNFSHSILAAKQASSPIASSSASPIACPSKQAEPNPPYFDEWINCRTVEELVHTANAALKDAQGLLDTLCAEAGVTVPPPVDLSFDDKVRLAVGDHPQKEALQKALEAHPEELRTIHHALCMKENATVWQVGSAFDTAYRYVYDTQGASAADSLYQRYMAIHQSSPTLRYDTSGATVHFNGKSNDEYIASIVRNFDLPPGFKVDGVA